MPGDLCTGQPVIAPDFGTRHNDRMPSQQTYPCRNCATLILPSTAAKTDGLCLICESDSRHERERVAREETPGCAACDGSGRKTYRFDWTGALAGGRHWDRKYPLYLKRVCKVRDGERYRCSVCNAVWFLHFTPDARLMTLVSAPYVPVFDAWSKRALGFPQQILEDARRIGANPVMIQGGDEGEVLIPCCVTTRQGERIELAALMFSDGPPIPSGSDPEDRLNSYRLMEDVASIEPSRFALPADVRASIASSHESAYDTSFTHVITPAGIPYTISGWHLFYNLDGVVGKDIRLHKNVRGSGVLNWGHGPYTVFVADWFPGANSLRIGFWWWLRRKFD